MGYNRALRDLDGQSDVTKTQLAILCIIICFAIDAINPVKVVLHVFPQIASWHVVILCALLIAYLVVTEIKPLLYFSVKVFFHSILSIVFREVHVIGLENVPQYGPVIFTGNHANQFIDAVTMVCTCQRTISYLVAEKSWNRPIIGHLAWALGAVPVKRAQDSAEVGVGKIRILHMPSDVEQLESDDTANQSNNHPSKEEKSADVKHTTNSPKVMLLVQGFDTLFSSQIQVRDKIRMAGSSTVFTVQSILSDTELYIEILENIPTFPSEPTDFHILKRVDQGEVYAAVLNRLGERGCIGIFPEGGSHDRRLARAADTIPDMLLNGHFLTQFFWPTWIVIYFTLFVLSDLLPLKVGVALIAYSALERDGVNIPIVPVGLNYFNAHRFRGRAIVEFGAPLFIDPNTLDSFKQGGAAKRQVCTDLLER
jgi:glycerol-3-phosphate O-acyltransferase/dihydroxyacetone phosphate acyltransferase